MVIERFFHVHPNYGTLFPWTFVVVFLSTHLKTVLRHICSKLHIMFNSIYFIIHSGQLIFHLVLLTAQFRYCFTFVFIVYLFLYLCIAPRNRLPRQMAFYKFIIIILLLLSHERKTLKTHALLFA